MNMYKFVIDKDVTMLEINPMVETEDGKGEEDCVMRQAWLTGPTCVCPMESTTIESSHHNLDMCRLQIN